MPAQFEGRGRMIIVRLLPDVASSIDLRTYNRLTNRLRVPPFEEVNSDRAAIVWCRAVSCGVRGSLHTIAAARPSGDKNQFPICLYDVLTDGCSQLRRFRHILRAGLHVERSRDLSKCRPCRDSTLHTSDREAIACECR